MSRPRKLYLTEHGSYAIVEETRGGQRQVIARTTSYAWAMQIMAALMVCLGDEGRVFAVVQHEEREHSR